MDSFGGDLENLFYPLAPPIIFRDTRRGSDPPSPLSPPISQLFNPNDQFLSWAIKTALGIEIVSTKRQLLQSGNVLKVALSLQETGPTLSLPIGVNVPLILIVHIFNPPQP